MGKERNSHTVLQEHPRHLCSLLLALLMTGVVAAATAQPPPPPERYVLDEPDVVSAGAEATLNARLEQYERESSNQIVVAIFRKLPAGSALEQFTVETAQAWRVGQADKDYGVVLFAFVDDRKLRIEVGYGLEGAIPDALARQILDDEITPHLRNGDFDSAMSSGVTALIAASQGEYSGSGRTVGQKRKRRVVPPLFLFFFLLIGLISYLRSLGGVRYDKNGRGTYHGGWGGWGGGGGGGFGGGGFGGGGFGGGGGGFGGGGASGGW